MGEFKRIYKMTAKSTPGWGYWGDYGQIEVGISSGRVESTKEFEGDKLHYHKKGVIFILVLEGSGKVEINGEDVLVNKDQVLRIAPREKYRHAAAIKTPFSWITFCTSKDPNDKVVVE